MQLINEQLEDAFEVEDMVMEDDTSWKTWGWIKKMRSFKSVDKG